MLHLFSIRPLAASVLAFAGMALAAHAAHAEANWPPGP